MIKSMPTSSTNPPMAHFNHTNFYYPYNITSTPATEETPLTFHYDLLIVPESDYENIRQGNLCGASEWTDALRSIERSALYDLADMYISKYSTDEIDEDKKQAWIDFKAEVRLTTSSSEYPLEVIYPEPPF